MTPDLEKQLRASLRQMAEDWMGDKLRTTDTNMTPSDEFAECSVRIMKLFVDQAVTEHVKAAVTAALRQASEVAASNGGTTQFSMLRDGIALAILLLIEPSGQQALEAHDKEIREQAELATVRNMKSLVELQLTSPGEKQFEQEWLTPLLEAREAEVEAALIGRLRKAFSERGLYGHYNLIQEMFGEEAASARQRAKGRT